jgi:hypothetical protein
MDADTTLMQNPHYHRMADTAATLDLAFFT